MENVNAAGLETMAPEMSRVRNYYRWFLDCVEDYLGRRILEVGPGYGNLARLLVEDGRQYVGVDSDPAVISRLRKDFSGIPSAAFYEADIAQEEWIARLSREGFDTLLSMNVLEHLPQPVELLKALRRIIGGGRLIVMVPAMPGLYGSLDEQAGHLRRYTPETLRAELQAAGTTPERIFYFNGIGAMGWFVSGRLLRQDLSSASLGKTVRFYDRWVIPVARRMEPLLRPFFGQSLIAVI